MSFGAIGAVLIVLVIVFVVGRVWFAVVEGALGGLRRLFGKKEPGVWHPLPQASEEKEDEDV